MLQACYEEGQDMSSGAPKAGWTVATDDRSQQDGGQLLSWARCSEERSRSQRAEPYGGTTIVLRSSWSSGWWMISSQHGKVPPPPIQPACFNSVWLQVLNIARAFTSVFEDPWWLTVSLWIGMKSLAAEWYFENFEALVRVFFFFCFFLGDDHGL